MGMDVLMLCAGVPINKTVYAAGVPIGPMATLGYGIGIGEGEGGAGVRQTSGNPISVPIICVFANITTSFMEKTGVSGLIVQKTAHRLMHLSDMNAFPVHLHVFL